MKISVLIVRDSPSNRYRLNWKGETFSLHVPRGTAKTEIDKILQKHRRWVKNRVDRKDPFTDKHRCDQELFKGKTVLAPDRIYLDGRPFSLLWEKDRQIKISIKYETRNLILCSPETMKAHFQDIIRRWFIHRFITRVHEKILFWNAILPFSARRVFIRSTRSQWGSMSRSRNMSLSWYLSGHREEALNYIILHELAHIPYPDHSPRFWDFVRKHLPDYQNARRTLHNFVLGPEWLDPFGGKKHSLEVPFPVEKIPETLNNPVIPH